MTDPLLGRVLRGRYRVERKLGHGGMGAVYVAVHLELARPVALKTLLDVNDERDIERFRTEALAAASLAHPHIVAVTDFAAPKGDEPAFLVMELLAGRSLAHVIRARGALSVDVAVHIALQILDAIGAAHGARILHRDLKPANVIVLDGADPDRPWIKVVDFGIAKLLDDESRHTTTGVRIGTPAYMAPEQLRGERATEAADIYAIGKILDEICSGARGDIAAVIQRAMNPVATQRFESCAAFAAALREATVVRAAPRDKSRWPLFIASTIATLAIAAIVVRFATPRASEAVSAPPSSASAAPSPIVDVDASNAVVDGTPDVDAMPSASAASTGKTGPPMVLSICAEGEVAFAPLCSELLWSCDCENKEGLSVFDSADVRDILYGIRTTDRSKQGAPCGKYTHGRLQDGAPAAWPSEGHYRCTTTCDARAIQDSARLAVPGTPCSGYSGENLRPGKWRPFKR